MQAIQTISKPKLLGYFIFSIFLNSLGNALTVAINLGSALWTAAAVNLSKVLPITLSVMLILSGSIVIVTNIIILGRFDFKRVLGNLIFMVPFSWLVGVFEVQLLKLHITPLPLWSQVILDCLGVVLIAVAISIYQRINWMLHPVDDLMQIIRFKYLQGNATVAQLIVFTPPIVAIVISLLVTHQLYAINIGTLFALAFQGTMVGIADKVVFPSLKHQNLATKL